MKVSSAKFYWTADCLEFYYYLHAGYPSPGYDGPISGIAKELQRECSDILWNFDGLDGWGHPIRYACSKDGQLYWMISPGSNGKLEIQPSFPPKWPTKICFTQDHEADIAYFTGFPFQWPEGYSAYESQWTMERFSTIQKLYSVESKLLNEPHSGVLLKEKGDLLMLLRRYQEAEPIFRALLETDPHSIQILCRMGEAKFYLGNYLEAVQNMDAAIKFDPNLKQAWYYKGLSLYGQHKIDEARQALIRAVSLDISLHKKLWDDLELVEPYQTVLWSFMKTIPAEGNKKVDSDQGN